ncbi:MAG: hypothetical protein ABFR62_07370 [Bacteroidota bacterium]
MKKLAVVTGLNSLLSISLIFLLFISSIAMGQVDNSSKLFEGWELRINGHVDSAKVVLDEIIEVDSTYAMAWYELSRIEHHMGLGNPRQIMQHLEKSRNYIDKAVLYDSSNQEYLYYKGLLLSLQVYADLMGGKENVEDQMNQIEENYHSLLKVNPEFYEAKLCLVDLYALVPEENGGSLEKAEKYTAELEKEDLVCGAKAREIMMPKDADYIAFWTKLIDDNKDNAELLEAKGRVYLLKNDPENSRGYFEKAIELNENKNYLFLDMGRYYTMQVMQGSMEMEPAVPLISAEYEKYIASEPVPCNSMKAWAKGQMAILKIRSDKEEEGKQLMEEAKTLDPYFSKAFGYPSAILFIAPNAVYKKFNYLSRPF